MSTLKNILKTILPFCICIAIFVFIAKRYSLTNLNWENINNMLLLPSFVIASFGYFILSLLLDAKCLQYFFNRFSQSISFTQTLRVRGVSYLGTLLNYNAGQGILALYLKKIYKAPLAKTFGTVLFIMSVDFILIILFAFISVHFVKNDPRPLIQYIHRLVTLLVPLTLVAYILWIVFWKYFAKYQKNPLYRFKISRWVLSHDTFHIFKHTQPKDYVIAFLYRVPFVFFALMTFKMALYTFQTHIDTVEILVYNPLVALVSAIPITPAGLGTGQAAAMELFKNSITSPFIQNQSITATDIIFVTSLIWALVNQFYKGIFGAICLLVDLRK